MKQKNIVILLVLTFVTVVVWIGSNIYHIIVTSTVDEELQEQIIPINPNFDRVTIDKLKTRLNSEPLWEYRASVSPIPSPGQDGAEVQPSGTESQPGAAADAPPPPAVEAEIVSPSPEVLPQVTNTQ